MEHFPLNVCFFFFSFGSFHAQDVKLQALEALCKITQVKTSFLHLIGVSLLMKQQAQCVGITVQAMWSKHDLKRINKEGVTQGNIKKNPKPKKTHNTPKHTTKLPNWLWVKIREN